MSHSLPGADNKIVNCISLIIQGNNFENMTLTVCNLCDSGHYDSEIQSQRKTEKKHSKPTSIYYLSQLHSPRDCRELVAFVATV